MKLILKSYANLLLDSVEEVYRDLETVCSLTIVTVGNDPANLVYVKNKIKKCTQVSNVVCDWIQLEENTTQETLNHTLDNLSCKKNVAGILLQQPLPKHLNAKQALVHIAPEKDVDGLTQMNKRFLYTGDMDNAIMPCTALGIMLYLGHYFKGDLAGKTTLVIGRSDLVGRPLADALERADATVIWANSYTDKSVLMQLAHQADIIVSAVGQASFITPQYISTFKKQLIIDVGINYSAEGKLVGDCDLDDVAEQDLCDVTAVPGGVGQLTTSVLLHNLLKCYEWQLGNK